MINQKFLALILLLGQAACASHSSLQGTVDKLVLEQRVILAGDGGDPDERTFKTLIENASYSPEITTVVLLGDNVYPDGLPESEDSEEARRFNSQLKALRSTKASVLIIPGNHDWGPLNAELRRLDHQHQMVKGWFGRGIMLPESGCPGPSVRTEGNSFTLAALDTETLLRLDSYPKNCTNRSLAETVESLRTLDISHPLVLLTHHPLASFGPNARLTDNCPMRMSCPKNREMVKALQSALKQRPALLCAAGHDHTLQLIEGDGACKYYAVSGALGELHSVEKNERLIASSDKNGFMLLEKFKSGTVKLSIITTSIESLDGELARVVRLK